MKLSTKTIAAVALIGAFSFGNAQAADIKNMPLNSVIGVNSADLRVTIDNGIATLFGTVENGGEAALAQAHVKKLEGVDTVRSNILLN